MLSLELDIINARLGKNYSDEDISLDNNEVTEKKSGQKIELSENIFVEISKAKRREHLRKVVRDR